MFRTLPLLLLLATGCGGPEAPSAPRDPALIEQALRTALQQQDLERSYDLFVELLGPPRDSSLWYLTKDLPPYRPDPAIVERDVPLLREAYCATVLDKVMSLLDDPAPREDATMWFKRCDVLGHPTFASADLERRRLAVRRYLQLETLAHTNAKFAPHEGPRIVAFVDDFALGEAVLESMLRRWQREHGPRGLRVSVVPLVGRGIRSGMRRLPAESEEAEVAAIHARARALGLTARPPLSRRWEWLWAHGARVHANFLFFADADGRIVARLSGLILDPTAFEETVQRLVSR